MGVACLGEMLDRRERVVVCDHGLPKRRARNGLLSGLSEIRGSILPPFRPEGVMTESIDVLAESIGVKALDGGDNLAMKAAPALLEQTSVGDLVGEGVLERVFE